MTRMITPDRDARGLFGGIAPWLAAILCLLPFAYAGFFFDDIYNSLVRGNLISTRRSFGEFLQWYLHTWVIGNGRFYPGAIVIGETSWYWADSLLKARTLQIALAGANIGLFFAVVSQVAGRRSLAVLSVMLLAAVVQFNPRWDGLSSFMPLNQVLALFIFTAWWSAGKALRAPPGRARSGWIATSTVALALALVTYEIGVTAWLGLLALAWHARRDAPGTSRQLLRIYVVTAVVYFATYLAFRISATGGGYSGIQTGSPAAAVTIAVAQFLSAFPLAFLANGVMRPSWAHQGPLVTGVLAVFVLLWLAVLRRHFAPGTNAVAASAGNGRLWVLGLALGTVPALIVGSAKGYQGIITYGDPYIVVYLQYFGSALMLALVLERVLRIWPARWLMVVLALVIGIVSAATVSSNVIRIKAKNTEFRKPRLEMERTVKQGLLKDVPEGSLLLVESRHVWESEGSPEGGLCSDFFSQHAGKRLLCSDLTRLLKAPDLGRVLESAPVYVLRRIGVPERKDHVELIGGGQRVSGEIGARGPDALSRGPAPAAVVTALGSSGFYGWEPSGRRDFAWASGAATLDIVSLASVPQERQVEISLESARDQVLVGTFGPATFFDAPVRGGERLVVKATLRLVPGNNVLRITPSGAPVRLGNDSRTFSFRLVGLQVR